MVHIEPTAQIASTVVRRGFVLTDAEPMKWHGDRVFRPDFLEIRYVNDHNGEGWHWSAEVRGRRVKKGGALGAADADLWFSDRKRFADSVPTWVRETAEANTPGDTIAAVADWADARETLEPWDGSSGVTGTWRGRIPVTVLHVQSATNEITLGAVNPADAPLFNTRRYSLVEFAPDGAKG